MTNKTKIKFDHYYIEKRSDNYFGVYDMWGVEITSGTSIWNACKKAKLLETGYETGYNDAKDIYCELF